MFPPPCPIPAASFTAIGTSGFSGASVSASRSVATVTIAPAAPLRDNAKITLRVKNVRDRVGKVMPADYVVTAVSAVTMS